uniref:Odorant receptor n=1 Tax=Eucryptorrhynchus brandti TaxID=436910 RepID=A0A8F4RSM2_EUCBR|nr:odorant receptor 43 [Eucryptorrhynchus brandti]
MRYSKHLMVSCGVWRTPYFKNPIIQKLYFYCGFLVQIFYLTSCTGMLIEFFCLLKSSDTKKLTENIRTTASCVLVAVKICIFQTGRFTRLFKKVVKDERDVARSNDRDIRTMHFGFAKYIYRFMAAIIGLGNTPCIFVVIWTIVLATNPSAERPVVISTYYPFDESKHYVATLFLEMFCAIIATEYFCVCQVLYISIMVFVKMQLRILQHQIRNFDNQTFNDDLLMIKKFIRSHQDIIRFVGELNEAIKFMLLVEFLCSSINIASSIVHLSVAENMDDIGYSACCAGVLTTQLLVFVWHANEINIESVNISSALYEVPWYEKSLEIQKMISIMILRSQRPLTLTIGPFKPLTNQIITQVINVAYSYVTIMTHFY